MAPFRHREPRLSQRVSAHIADVTRDEGAELDAVAGDAKGGDADELAGTGQTTVNRSTRLPGSRRSTQDLDVPPRLRMGSTSSAANATIVSFTEVSGIVS